jgi:hypothetical protein
MLQCLPKAATGRRTPYQARVRLFKEDGGYAMVLSRDELIGALKSEVKILLHLASKIEPKDLDYRPSPKQRSLLELMQYLVIMGPIHARGVKKGVFNREEWGKDFNDSEIFAKTLNLDQVKEEIGKQPALFEDVIGSCSDEDLRAEIAMFGPKASRGSMFVGLVLSHYAAYRMQLFLYLKGCGHEELNTLNLWAGVDGAM